MSADIRFGRHTFGSAQFGWNAAITGRRLAETVFVNDFLGRLAYLVLTETVRVNEWSRNKPVKGISPWTQPGGHGTPDPWAVNTGHNTPSTWVQPAGHGTPNSWSPASGDING